MRLLLVEDDWTISRFVLKGLGEDHHVVDLAEDGLAALDQAGAADYDAVVLDLMLPGLDGFDLCRQMRGQGIDTPVLVIMRATRSATASARSIAVPTTIS